MVAEACPGISHDICWLAVLQYQGFVIIELSSDLAAGIGSTVCCLLGPPSTVRTILMRTMNRAAVQENDISGRAFHRDTRVVTVITSAMPLPRFGPVFMKWVMMTAGNNPQAAIFLCGRVD